MASRLYSQSTVRIVVFDDEQKKPLGGVLAQVIDTPMLAAMSDSSGLIVLQNIQNGSKVIELSYIGYLKKRIKVQLPLVKSDEVLKVEMDAANEELEQVEVVTTRTVKNIEDIPMNIEVVSGEELQERAIDKPSDISHALKEQSGVQIQRTSASSGTFNIRLEGLRGKYVQILKDGFPLFGGLSEGLSISQIPPMDLQQIEIIKGPASTLYGGDAIAGVVNLITKQPTESPQRDLLFNMESTKAVDAGAYFSQRIKWFGYSLIAQYRNQLEAQDWDHDNFSESPKLQRYLVSPDFYFYINRQIKIKVGFNYSYETRMGGAMPALNHIADSTYDYLEINKSARYGAHLLFEYNIGAKGKLTIKNSFNTYDRHLNILEYCFGGRQISSVTEANYNLHIKKHDLVIGMDCRNDRFTESRDDTISTKRNYTYATFGLFVQEDYIITPKTTLEAGMRLDYNTAYGFFPLPHMAWLQKWNALFQTRLNGGMGYKLPSIFQDESEEANYRDVFPIKNNVKPELSVGATIDWRLRLPSLKGVQITFSQLLFYTHIFNPIHVKDLTYWDLYSPDIFYENASGYIETKGMETKMTTLYRGINGTITYALQDQRQNFNNVKSVSPLTSRHIVSLLVGYEMKKKFSVGIDCYYYSPQKLSDGTTSKDIWEFGMNAQVFFKYVTLFANLENILDIRQSRYGQLIYANPTLSAPRFAEIYGPLDGRIFNAGFKLRLGEIHSKGKQLK